MIRKRICHSGVKREASIRSWQNKLLNIPCFILGNGPSLTDHPIHLLEDYFTIGINRAFKVLDPTILLWQDVELFYTERYDLPKLKAIKYCRDISDPIRSFYHFKILGNEYRLPKTSCALFGHGSSGPLAFQLAYVLGCNPIIILGYDCCYRDTKTDFYGINRYHSKYTLDNCRIGLNWIKNSNSGRQIINCSENTTLGRPEKLEKVIEKVKFLYPETGRDFFVNRIFNRLPNLPDLKS